MRRHAAALAGLVAFGPAAALAQQASPACEPTDSMHAYKIMGTDSQGQLNAFISPEIYGEHNFRQVLGNGWEFVLARGQYGWTVHLFSGGTDLTAGTGPRSGPNPREIFGWHFRNAGNSGPNMGDVNAPQHMRAFVISPAAAGLDSAGDGIGWLNVVDHGLSDLEQSQKARMTWLKFDACLSWPKTEADKRAEADAASPVYREEEVEIFGSCGLDLARYDLNAAVLPRTLGGDMDGDGSLDEVAQISERSSGARGYALCRAGTWVDLAGLPGASSALDPGYAGQVEAWHWVSDETQLPRRLGGIDLPDADGDILILERIEKQAVALFWKDGALHSQELFHLVTE